VGQHAVAAREAIARGSLRGATLAALLQAVPTRDRDAWVDAVLGIAEMPDDDPSLPRGAVPYLPCGVAEILAVVELVPLGPSSVLVDVGSGLGRVVVLAHLLSGACARGIEIQEHLASAARASAARLALHPPVVTFVHGDATSEDVSLEGDVFFLYAPFNGEMLRRALERLRAVARSHPIVVCTVGVELASEDWLTSRPPSSGALTIYDSRRS